MHHVALILSFFSLGKILVALIRFALIQGEIYYTVLVSAPLILLPRAESKLPVGLLKKFFVYCSFCQMSGFLPGNVSTVAYCLPRFEESIGKYRCELRQQMSRSNNGLVSLFLRLCGNICVVL